MEIYKKIKPIIPLILSLLLALALFFMVNDFIRTVIIGPMLYVIWFVTLVVESIPQVAIWTVFILVMLVIAFASLRKRKSENPMINHSTYYNSGPVEKWARMLKYAQDNRFTRWRLANDLKSLTQRISSPSDDNETKITYYLPDLPVEISNFFEAPLPTKTQFWEWISKNTIDETESALDLDPEVVIQYLEEQYKL